MIPGAFDRADALRRLEDTHFDVVIVGGGITGVGCALDAASRGLRTALVERDDFASGTSSKSSKLIHGGLRYLQQGDVRLVYDALAERQRLRVNAPHLVKVLPFLIPVFATDGVVSRKLARAMGSAMWMYDLTGGLRIGKLHKRISAEEALAHFPTLPADRLMPSYLYYDARADDARLCLTVARTAALHFGAVVVNGAEVTGLDKDDTGRVTGLTVAADGRTLEVTADAVVNAAGVWSDEVRSLDEPGHVHTIRPAKGIHITVPWHKVRNDIAAVIPVPGDRRSVFVVPWGDFTFVGTTDTDYDGPLDDPQCTAEDVAYLLRALNGVVTPEITESDIVGTWAGLRPLVADPEASGRTADLSRRHRVHRSATRRRHHHRREAHDLPGDGRRHHRRGAQARPRRRRPRTGAAPQPHQAHPAPRRGGLRRTDGRGRPRVAPRRRCRAPPRRPLRRRCPHGPRHRRGRRRPGRAAGPGPPLPPGRGRLRGALRDGPVGRRRAQSAHPCPSPGPRRLSPSGHRGGGADRAVAGLERRPSNTGRPRRTRRSSRPSGTRRTCPRSRSTRPWAPDGSRRPRAADRAGSGRAHLPDRPPGPRRRVGPHRRHGRARSRRRRPTARGHRRRRVGRARPAGRGQPGLVAAGHDLGRRRSGRRPRRCRRATPRPGPGRRRAPRLPRGPRTRHRRRRAQRGGRRLGAALRRCGPRPVRPGRRALGRPRRPRGRRARRHLRRPARAGAAGRARPHGGPLAAVDDPLHGRRLARLSRRRPAVEPLRQGRGPRGGARRDAGRRHRGAHRGPRPPGRRPRPHPALRRLRRHPRRDHRRPPPGLAGARGRTPRRLRLRHLRRRGGRLSPHRPAGPVPRRPPPLRRGRGRPQLRHR